MVRQIKGLLYYNVTESRYSLSIFWIILMSIFVVTLFIGYLLKNTNGAIMAFSLTVPMYIYCGIFGFLTVKDKIPFALKMGATRKSIFISLGGFFLILSLGMSVLGSSLQTITNRISVYLGMNNFKFIHISHLINDSWFNRILIDFSMMFFSLSLLFIIGLIFYRFGLIGGGSTLGLFVILILTGFAQGYLTDFFIYLFERLDNMLFIQLFLISLIIYAISFLFLRRITIVSVK